MSFVFWEDSSVLDLERIWDRADAVDRPRISSAVAVVHSRLTQDPLGFSESRYGRNRVIVCMPLVVTFRISVDASQVRVRQVRFAISR